MLKIVVVDRSAEARSRMVDELTELMKSDIPDLELMPRVSVTPLALQEMKFHAAPHVVIVGPEIVQFDMTEIGAIRKALPDVAILVRLPQGAERLTVVEQLARIGADDVLPAELSGSELMSKLIMLSRRRAIKRTGQLILVDGGKGGVGVTSIAAGLAETLVSAKKRVCLIDLDVESQDLSRFLQARPYLNDNLQLLFDRERPVTQEFVEQALVDVWEKGSGLSCMTPVPDRENLYDATAPYARVMVSILEVLDSLFDCVIVDTGSARGSMLKTLYRVADKVLFVIHNDPAALFASADKIMRHRSLISPNADLVVVENAAARGGLQQKVLRDEVARAAGLHEGQWLNESIPFCKSGQRWPGSGATIVSLGKEPLASSYRALAEHLKLVPASGAIVARVGFREFLDRTTKLLMRSGRSDAAVAQPQLGAARPSARLPEPMAMAPVALPAPIEELLSPPQLDAAPAQVSERSLAPQARPGAQTGTTSPTQADDLEGLVSGFSLN